MDNIQQLKQWIDGSDRIVFFGGAGVSTESGIPDFRSVDGLYNQRYKYPPEVMLSYTFYREHTAEFYDFYREKLLCPTAKPNAAHFKLAELEAAGKLKAVITQNIDGLHQMAGSKTAGIDSALPAEFGERMSPKLWVAQASTRLALRDLADCRTTPCKMPHRPRILRA